MRNLNMKGKTTRQSICMLSGQGNISETRRAKDANHKKETNKQEYIYLETFHLSNTPFSECRCNLHSTDAMCNPCGSASLGEYQKPSELKQQKHILSKFWVTIVWDQHRWVKIKLSADLGGRIRFLLLPAPEVTSRRL